MTIRRKIQAIILAAVALGLALSVLFLAAQRWDAATYTRQQLMGRLAEQTFRLSLLYHELYLHPESPRVQTQWNTADGELESALRSTRFKTAEEQAVVGRLDGTRARLGALVAQLLALTAPSPVEALELTEERRERLNSQIIFSLQAMVDDVLSLQYAFREEAASRRRNTNRLVIGMALLLTGLITLLAWLTGRSIIRPLMVLRNGTAQVATGDLSYRVGTTAQDEIGSLSRDFDAMLERLQQVTASREELTREVERRIRTEEALRRSEESLKLAQGIAHLGHWEIDLPSGSLKWSDETYRILGYEPRILEPSHERFLQPIHPDDREAVDTCLRSSREGRGFETEYRIMLADGRQRAVHARCEVLRVGARREPRVIGTLQAVAEGEPMAILGVIQDITERKALESKLEREAHTDALTGCANRRYFLEQFGHELARARRYSHELSLLMLDLDHFKQVNDRYGHQVGDLALKMVVQVCRTALREEDIIGRIGGEEFAILLPETGLARAQEAAERVRAALAAADIPAADGPIHVTTSIGVTTLRSEGESIDTLLGHADRALYAAKADGRNRVCSE
ncbi:MAG: diguanylate cyclase [Thiohalomonadaceae bacterium]